MALVIFIANQTTVSKPWKLRVIANRKAKLGLNAKPNGVLFSLGYELN